MIPYVGSTLPVRLRDASLLTKSPGTASSGSTVGSVVSRLLSGRRTPLWFQAFLYYYPGKFLRAGQISSYSHSLDWLRLQAALCSTEVLNFFPPSAPG